MGLGVSFCVASHAWGRIGDVVLFQEKELVVIIIKAYLADACLFVGEHVC